MGGAGATENETALSPGGTAPAGDGGAGPGRRAEPRAMGGSGRSRLPEADGRLTVLRKEARFLRRHRVSAASFRAQVRGPYWLFRSTNRRCPPGPEVVKWIWSPWITPWVVTSRFLALALALAF